MQSIVDYVTYVVNIPYNFRGDQARDFLDQAPDYPAYATVLYLLAVFYLPGFVEKHDIRLNMKWVVAGWNLFLSIVSIFGSYYTIGMMYEFLFNTRGFHHTACELIVSGEGEDRLSSFTPRHDHHEATAGEVRNHYYNPETAGEATFDRNNLHQGNHLISTYYETVLNKSYFGPRAFYMALFMYLKTPELLDTIFLILQRKPVSFLHWYHHIVTAIFCWHASYVLIPSGIFFATMNYFVHSIMYFYYFLVMMGLRKKIRPFAPVITLLQVLQMFIGMGITVYTYLQLWLGPAKSDTLFYKFSNLLFSACSFVLYEARHLLTSGSFAPRSEVPAYKMEDHFYGCNTDKTNVRMGMMMYGSYCVLFAVLFKELYLDDGPKKNSLVLARAETAQPKTTEANAKKSAKTVEGAAAAKPSHSPNRAKKVSEGESSHSEGPTPERRSPPPTAPSKKSAAKQK